MQKTRKSTAIRESRGDRIFQGVVVFIGVIIMLIVAYPLYFTVIASISKPEDVLMGKVLLWPRNISFESYKMVIAEQDIWMGYGNTIFYVVAGTVINMILTTIGAYALSRKGWPLRQFFVFLFVFTMYFSAGMVPGFMMVKELGLLDTRWAILLPGAVNTWNLIVMRTAFASVPDEMEESAHIDGASDLRIMVQIYIPLAKATIAVMILFYAVAHWNSWFSALIYLTNNKLYPVQMFVREILMFDAAAGTTEDANAVYIRELTKYATIIVAVVPILCVYPFVQKYFVKGVMLGSVKG